MGLKPTEILLILAVLLLLFGASRLPQLGSSLGSAIRNFKRGFGGEDEGTPEPRKENLTAFNGSQGVDASSKVASKEG